MTQRLAGAAALALFLAILCFALTGASVSLAPLGLLLGFWVALGAIAELVDRAKFFRTDVLTSFRRLFGLPRTAWATALAHFGLGVSVIGVVAATAWQSELVTTMTPGQTVTISGHTVTFEGMQHEEGPNFISDAGRFTISVPGAGDRQTVAERRVYTASGMPTTEAGHRDLRLLAALRATGRAAGGRQVGGAALVQALCDADLARRGGDGARRLPVAELPAAAHRRAAPGNGAAGRQGGRPMRPLLALLLLALLSVPALAVRPDEMLSDPVLETRARSISEGLRCLVCQNQSIDDSDADLAHDLRVIVRERLVAGDSDQEVRDYLVARYGEFVLLNPVLGPHTILLWIAGPTALLIGGIAVFAMARRKRTVATAAALSAEEERALRELEGK